MVFIKTLSPTSRTSCLTVNPLNSVVYAGTLTYSGWPGGVFQSKDKGQSWQEIKVGLLIF